MQRFKTLSSAILAIILAFGLAGCRHLSAQPYQLDKQPSQKVQSDSPMPARIEFATQDGVTIVADWYYVPDAAKAVLLVHMLPATKESYSKLATKLNSAGISALAIDLRGHGESTAVSSGKLDFQTFSPAQHQASIADLEAALGWLSQQEVAVAKISLVGASIGANLTLQAAANHPEITKVVLLSPGLDYHGVQTEPAMVKISDQTQIWLISSEGDAYSADSVHRLNQLRPSAVVKILSGSSHGTDLLDKTPSLLDEITRFFSD